MQIDEEKLVEIVADQVADRLISNTDIKGEIRSTISKKVNAIFAEHAEADLAAIVADTVRTAFDREYTKVTAFGTPNGKPTSIRKELELIAQGYWSAKVNPKTGKPTDDGYGAVTRAEYLMTTICAEDFSAAMKAAATNVTGALKDGLRGQIAKQMDAMLNELFRVKSLQDQGKVEKPY